MLPTLKITTQKEHTTHRTYLRYEIEEECDEMEYTTYTSLLENFNCPYFLKYSNFQYFAPVYEKKFFGLGQTKKEEGRIVFESEDIDMTLEDYLKEMNDNLENSFNCKEVNKNVMKYNYTNISNIANITNMNNLNNVNDIHNQHNVHNIHNVNNLNNLNNQNNVNRNNSNDERNIQKENEMEEQRKREKKHEEDKINNDELTGILAQIWYAVDYIRQQYKRIKILSLHPSCIGLKRKSIQRNPLENNNASTVQYSPFSPSMKQVKQTQITC